MVGVLGWSLLHTIPRHSEDEARHLGRRRYWYHSIREYTRISYQSTERKLYSWSLLMRKRAHYLYQQGDFLEAGRNTSMDYYTMEQLWLSG